MYLEFTKMHGLGNDFMVVDLITQARLFRYHYSAFSRSSFCVGFDQLFDC